MSTLTDDFERDSGHAFQIDRSDSVLIEVVLQSAAAGHAAIASTRFDAQIVQVANSFRDDRLDQRSFGDPHAGANKMPDAFGAAIRVTGMRIHKRRGENPSLFYRWDCVETASQQAI